MTTEVPSDGELKLINELAKKQIHLEKQIAHAEAKLDQLQKDWRQVAERELPEAMIDAGVTDFTTTKGENISIKTKLKTSVSQAKKPAICRWLLENGYGDIVSEDVIVKFKKGEMERVQALTGDLEKAGWDNYSVQENVNSNTLQALLRERMNEGEIDDLEFFGTYRMTHAIITN